MSAIQERQVESASMAAETLPEGGVASPGASPAPEMTKDEMHSGSSTTDDSSVGNDTSADHTPAHTSETVSHPVAVADLLADSDLLADGQTVGAGSDRGKHQA